MNDFFEMLKSKIERYYFNAVVGTLVGDLPMNKNGSCLKCDEVFDFEAIKIYTDFFNVVPKDKYEEVTTQIAHIIFSSVYSHNLRIWQNEKIKIIKNDKEPKRLIKDELKSLRNFKNVIIRNFQSPFKGNKTYGYCYDKRFKRIDFLNNSNEIKEYNIDDLFEIVDLMIHDLETEEYLFLAKENYRERANTNTGINQYKNELIAICKKYKIYDYKTKIDFFIQDFYKGCAKNIL